jgi:sulfonate transport system ATP-binding protein
MLVLDRIGKTYPNGVNALEGVSLAVGPGEILVVVGGSGCGKSTLLRAISGLDTPTKGRVALDGTAITAPHEKIGIIFQEPRLLPWLDVAGNVGFGLEHRPKAERQARVASALARVGLTDKARMWPRELSGGQAQPSPSPAPWCRARRCCFSTSRSRRSMPSPAPICRIICSTCGRTSSRLWSW